METPRNVKMSPQKILIVKLSAFGDVVHALPIADYIKEYLPNAEIDWVVEEPLKELLAAHPLINRIYALDTKRLRRNPLGSEARQVLLYLRREMAKGRYNAALDLQGNIKSAIFTILSQAPRRYGFSRLDVREFPNLLATNIKVTVNLRPIRMKLLHIAKRFLEEEGVLLKKEDSFYNNPLNHIIDYPEQANQRQLLIEEGWRGEPIIGIIPGTTWKTKMWHPKRWIELMKLLCRKKLGRILIFWGNEKERSFSEKLVLETAQQYSLHGGYNPIVWRGGSIRSLIATLSLTKVVIGPDTGPLHLAALIGIPTISFYRSTDSRRNAPSGGLHSALQSPLSCSPCLKKKCLYDEACSASISAVEIANYLEKRLSEAWKR
ncbi:MAG: glycosyltransferase family 9 protein [Syntrophobacterales bacterium]|nr:glycosyltransferase family 9 protein [Syntrophobacterales bacterium]